MVEVRMEILVGSDLWTLMPQRWPHVPAAGDLVLNAPDGRIAVAYRSWMEPYRVTLHLQGQDADAELASHLMQLGWIPGDVPPRHTGGE